MKIKDFSKDNLYKLGFHYSGHNSTLYDTYYCQRFPVYKYKRKPVLECELCVCLENGNVSCDVYYAGTNNIYSSYYNRTYSTDNDVVSDIDKQLKGKFKKMGIR